MPRQLAPLIALLLCASAHAQVRHCTEGGKTVFQAGPCAVSARTEPAPAAAASPAPKGKRTIADLLRERDGEERYRPKAAAFERDGAEVLKPRMGAY